MEIVYTARAAGKTTKLMNWLRQDKRHTLITFNQPRKMQLQHDHPELQKQIYTMREYMMSGTALHKKVAIDDAEIVLQNMVKHPIDYITMSKTDYKMPKNADRPINHERD